MPRHGDDQCEECGGIRVAFSTLCADCLVEMISNIKAENREKNREIERLVQEVENYRDMLEDAVWYGFKQNRKVAEMVRQINELTQEVEDYNI